MVDALAEGERQLVRAVAEAALPPVPLLTVAGQIPLPRVAQAAQLVLMGYHVPSALRPLGVSPPPSGHGLRVLAPRLPMHPAMALLTLLQLVAAPYHLLQQEVTDHWLRVSLLSSVRNAGKFGPPQATQSYKMDNFAW